MKHVCTAIAALMLLATPMLRAQSAPSKRQNPPAGIQSRDPGNQPWHGHGEGWNRGRREGWDRGRHEGWNRGRREERGRDDWRGRERRRVRVRFGLFGWRWVWRWGSADWCWEPHGGRGHGRR